MEGDAGEEVEGKAKGKGQKAKVALFCAGVFGVVRLGVPWGALGRGVGLFCAEGVELRSLEGTKGKMKIAEMGKFGKVWEIAWGIV